MHGKQSEVEFDPACPLFRGCEAAGRGDKDCAAIARYRGEDLHE